jgi:hypothetical protein
MHPSLPTSPLLNATTTPSGNRSNKGKNHEHQSPEVVKIQHPLEPWAKGGSEKFELFAYHLAEVFTRHDNTLDPEVERELVTHIQHSENLQAFPISEFKQVIKQLKPLKAPGSDLITAHMIQEMPSECLQTILYTFNAINRLKYRPVPLKQANIIMTSKPGINPTEVASYKPISLLAVISKILEKLLLKRIYSDTHLQALIPQDQFGFRKAHSTIQQCHRLTDIMNKTLENQEYCSAVFLDVSQAFDKVWHQGLMLKIKQNHPLAYFNLLKSYLQNGYS